MNPEEEQRELPNTLMEKTQKQKIVILDDDLGQFFKDAITDHTDRFEIKKFTDGDLAWAELTHLDPVLLITDIIHPGLDGWELLRRLEERAVKYPILVVSSGITQMEIEVQFPHLKAAMLLKPFSHKVFLESVDKMVATEGLKAGPVKLD